MWTRGRLLGADVAVTGVAIDTRTLRPGDLFVAIKGERVDGHDFVGRRAARGAVAAMVHAQARRSICRRCWSNDTTLALGDLASAVRAQRHVRVVGITGSNGKTTVKTLVASILSRHGRTHVNAGNYNNELGLPLTLLAMPEDTEYAVLEMGAGKPGDIAYLAAIARPDIGLVNTIAPAHLERMGSIEGVAETKGALYQALPADGVAVINADDAFRQLLRRPGRHAPGAALRPRPAAPMSAPTSSSSACDGSRFVLSTPPGDAEVRLPLAGRHNIANALAAAAVALALEVPLDTIVAGPGTGAAAWPGGLQPSKRMAGGWTLIDDSYNANPGSVAAAIDTLALAAGERWLVLGDMAELGADARALHARHRRACARARASTACSRSGRCPPPRSRPSARGAHISTRQDGARPPRCSRSCTRA